MAETGGNAVITVTRTGSMFGPHFAPSTIDYATSASSAVPDQDYMETSGTLQFKRATFPRRSPFRSSTTRRMTASGRSTWRFEPGRRCSPWHPRTPPISDIGDNDVAGSIQFSAATYSVNEDAAAGTATITVTRSGGSASDVTVQYATSNGTGQAGTDYSTATGTLTFDSSGPGATTQTFTVPIVGNGLPDGNRTVNLTLHTPRRGAALGSQKTAVLTIVDDEIAFQFSQANYSVSESAGSATITVTRMGPKPRRRAPST